MFFEGTLLELNVRYLLAFLGLIVFASLAYRATRKKDDLPVGQEVWQNKGFLPLIWIGLIFFVIWVFLLFAYDGL
jgi:hypothetical protein